MTLRYFLPEALERAARLAILNYVAEPDDDPEIAIQRAVDAVTGDAEVFYDAETVKQLVILANPAADLNDLLGQL